MREPADPPPTADTEAVWEEHYNSRGQIWSGRPNSRLVELASELTPGSALDMGCGEGGDAVWLASLGWQVLAVDVSTTALRRAARAATEADVHRRITFAQHDLARTFPDGRFELVSAHFLHHRHPWDRDAVLRRAASAVAPGGTLLVVDHGEAPPWSEHRDHHFATADEVLAGLRLDDDWLTVRVGPAEREALGPPGRSGTLRDNIVMVRRRGGAPAGALTRRPDPR